MINCIKKNIKLFQFAGWVSAAAIPKPNYGPYLPYDFDATRSAYLFFSIVGWILAIAFFVLMIMNIVNWNFFARLPWILLVSKPSILLIFSSYNGSIYNLTAANIMRYNYYYFKLSHDPLLLAIIYEKNKNNNNNLELVN